VTREPFEQALDADPDDWTLRLVYADWLAEQGDALERAQRWMAQHQKRPATVLEGSGYGIGWTGPRFAHQARTTYPGLAVSLLPGELFDNLPRKGKAPARHSWGDDFKGYLGRRQAEQALAVALG
jgi:uncharacterized protein (TIGR02996 family)